tara:strand:- start:458 stop:718 length:261 start_codon:yes stop_codon:yes gene_type:complete
MKKLLGILVLGLLMCSFVNAKITPIEIRNIQSTTVSTVCIDGYKLVITSSNNGESIVQAYEGRDKVIISGGITGKIEGRISLPQRC